jgi:thiol-disulfide isomerase/thioredoxin
MTEPPAGQKPPLTRRPLLIAVAAIAGALIGTAGVYGIGGFQRNAPVGTCQAAVEHAKRLDPLAHGEVAAVSPATKPLMIPNMSFVDRNGTRHTLDEWRGRTVLLNLWATWCIPCRREMPALDALEQKLGGPKFEVVALNIDTRNLDRPKSWLANVGVSRLSYYADPSAKVFQDLKVIGRAAGLPTSILIDPNGCELGYIAGPAEWASEDALKLISAAMAKS